LRTIDKWERLGEEGLRELLGAGRRDSSGDFTPGAGLPDYAIQRLLSLVFRTRRFFSAESQWTNEVALSLLSSDLEESSLGSQAVSDLRQIAEVLSRLGVGDDQWRLDTSIVRGLEYYTGVVFEAELPTEFLDITGKPVRLGSVGGGGRYDDLVARFRGERIPATGFSIGVSRLAAALQAQQTAEADGPVVVLVMDQARVGDAFAMADELRRAGVRAEAYLGGAGMKAQLKYADKRNAPIAVIQGGDEFAKGVVTLKDLKLGERLSATVGDDREAWNAAREKLQREVPRAGLVAAVKEMLGQ
jgi:histidyl-tRNA synthetase